MKNRKGFVSNSSSSSFILAVDDVSKDVKISISIEKCISKKASTKEELDAAFIDEYGYGNMTIDDFLAEENYYQEQYDKCLDSINRGKTIIIGTASNEDDDSAALAIYYGALDSIDDKDVEIIHNDD
jgi:hypothetical protein